MGYGWKHRIDGTNRPAGALAIVFAAFGLSTTAARAQRPSASPIDSTVLRIAVDDLTTGQAIAGARVELYSLSAIRRSDDLGRTIFRGVTVGYQRVRVSAIGYQPVNRIIAVSRAAPRDSTATLIELEPAAQLLDTVTTSASRRLSRTAKLDAGAFDMRRKMGVGHFLDADQIDAEAWRFSLGEMIAAHVPGMRDGGANVYTTRPPSEGFTRNLHPGECDLDVWVDGIHQSAAFRLDEIDPGEVAGMEIYTLTEMPPQFKSPSGGNPSGSAECGALVLWMRR